MRAPPIPVSLGFIAILAVIPAFAAPNTVAGRHIAQRCKACHSVGVKGASPNPAAPPFRTLSQKYPLENLQEALVEGIIVGHAKDMPRTKLTPRQAEDFLRYLAAIQKK